MDKDSAYLGPAVGAASRVAGLVLPGLPRLCDGCRAGERGRVPQGSAQPGCDAAGVRRVGGQAGGASPDGAGSRRGSRRSGRPQPRRPVWIAYLPLLTLEGLERCVALIRSLLLVVVATSPSPLHTPAARGGGAGLAMAPRVSAAAVAGGMDGGRPSDRDRSAFNRAEACNIGMQ